MKEQEIIIGIDEVGRGCLAGPVIAAAVAVPRDWSFPGICDSKLLTAPRRQQIAQELTSSVRYALGQASSSEIDQLNILQATKLAMRRAFDNLPVKGYCYIDGNMKFPDWPAPYSSVIKGDQKVPAISAASIIAKVYRDQLMQQLSLQYPGYGWENNAGYGTKAHLQAIEELGVTEQHRRSFRPVRQQLAKAEVA